MEIRSLTSIGSAEGKGFELTHVTAMLPVADYVAGFRNIEKFLGLCKQCPKFGQSWTCPPCEFDVKAFVDNFKYAHILGSKMTFDDAILASTVTPEAVNTVCRDAMRYGLTKASAYLRRYEHKYPGSICFLGSHCFVATNLVRVQTANPVDTRTMCEFR